MKKNNHYKYYGGRGIEICNEWLGKNGFINFFEYLGECPEVMTLERIDNDGNYEPENIKWATYTEQGRNQSKTKLNEDKVKEIRELLQGNNLTQKEIADIFNIDQGTISAIKLNKIWRENVE